MAGIDLGPSQRRAFDHPLPLLPFIDFMLCMVAFLLVTAVWSRMARLDLDAVLPGDRRVPDAAEPAPALHVEARAGDRFSLEWKKGATVLSTEVVDGRPRWTGDSLTYPGLADAVERSWRSMPAAQDGRRQVAVVHSSNAAPFEQMAAVIDAVYATRRGSDAAARTRAFNVALASD